MSGNANNRQDDNEPSDLPQINFLFKTMLARDPSKRRVKPTPTVDLLPLALESESEDSDFRIEDDETGGDSDDSDDSESDSEDQSESEEEEPEAELDSGTKTAINGDSETPSEDASKLADLTTLKPATTYQLPSGIPPIRVCCICLGTHSSDLNEVVECDSCGILVHEGCYGVTESGSVSSTASSCSTEPWFCEPCQANILNPPCQLCPNLGGALKETDTGLWVHLVCALYIPGIAFGEVDKLTQVTLFEMPYNRWGAKSCSLCSDPWLSRTGVCIGCDAGMCRTFFHVTCAQREGLLSETFHEDAAQADPFYANCKLHTEKSTMKRRKSNYLSHQRHLQWWTNRRSAGQDLLAAGAEEDVSLRRILRKLERQRVKFQTRHWPRATWVPTQKMPRLLTTSASAVRRLGQKAALMGVDVEGEEVRESHVTAVTDVPRKWHLPPAFSVEFIAYVIDRDRRISQFREQMAAMKEEFKELDVSEKQLRLRYDCLIDEQSTLKAKETTYQSQLTALHQILAAISPAKKTFPMPSPNGPRRISEDLAQRRASLSPSVKVQKVNRPRESIESISLTGDHSNQSSQDFWVADIQAGPSNRNVHSSFSGNGAGPGSSLSPGSTVVSPRVVLKRVKSSSPRHHLKKRKKSKSERVDKSDPLDIGQWAADPSDKVDRRSSAPLPQVASLNTDVLHNSGSTAEVPKLKIKIKPILPKVTQSGFPFIFANSDSDHSQPPPSESSSGASGPNRGNVQSILCSVCGQPGLKSTTVSCDECLKVFHFGCLDPPVKKTPKQRGYSWHCADCDSSAGSD